MTAHPDIDQSWQPLATSTRQALGLLGYDLFADCLPGEAHPCGGSFAEHAAAHLATLHAVVEHRATCAKWLAMVERQRETKAAQTRRDHDPARPVF